MSIHPTAVISPSAQLADGVLVGPYAVIGEHVTLSAGVQVGAHAVLDGPLDVGPRTRFFPHAVIGQPPQDQKYAGEQTALSIGSDNIFREFSTANRGTAAGGGLTRVGDHNLMMAYSHIAHDCQVGDHCVFANCASLAGHVIVEDYAILGGLSAVHQRSRIGRCAMLGGGAKVAQDVPPFTIAQGDRARLFGLNVVGLRRRGLPLETLQALRAAYRELFQHNQPLRVAVEQVREVYADVAEVQELVRFIEESRRGICRSAGTDVPTE
ncbi:MAG: acyl-ACP--UDP-N-acetylglucosamine O-acyltransferase [Myxococcota bacterium]